MPRPIRTRKNLTTARYSSPAPILKNETIDLFDGVRVTWPEVRAWVEAVAPHCLDGLRFEFYITGWNVPDKVRQAKLSGCWPPADEKKPQAEAWGKTRAWRM